MLQFEKVQQLRDIDEILCSDKGSPFQRIKDIPEPYRSYRIACEQLTTALEGRRVPLIVDTKAGKALLWRLWPSQIGIVMIKNGYADEQVTFINGPICYDLEKIVINPPKW